MNRRKVLTILLIAALILPICYPMPADAAGATGTVTATSLNVRVGAGTSHAVLNVNGSDVKLSAGTVVTILETLSGWYKVSFDYNGSTLTGYVSSDYVTLNRDSAPAPSVIYKTVITYKPINIPAKINKKVAVKAKANGKNLVINKKKVTLKANKSIKIKGQSLKKGTIWYQINFTYSGKTRTGYIEASTAVMTLASPATAKIFNCTKSVTVRTKANASSNPLMDSGKKVTAKKDLSVSIIKEKTVKGVKWFRISFTYNKKTKKGYVQAKYVKPAKTKVVTQKAISSLTNAQFEKYLTQQNFPESYKPALRELHKAYPFWQFEAYHTNLKWATVIKNESKVGLNLLPNWYGSDWKSTDAGAYDPATGKYTVFDGSTWVSASKKAVSYYMDPRNFLTASGVFQFELLQYQDDYQVASGVNNIMKNTPFREGKTFTYPDGVTGKDTTISYTNAIIAGAKVSGVSPYHLAARIRQEVVRGVDTVSDSVSGKTKEYPGIYNFYNIGANNGKTPILTGLLWASGGTAKATTYLRPWDDRYKAIVGGASFLGVNYITRGQNTIYLEKFNVTANSMYSHQFMANVEAAYSESISSKKAYSDALDTMPLIFSVPVYLEMPTTACPKPNGTSYY